MAAPSPAARPSLTDFTPFEFATAVCEHAIMRLNTLMEELGSDVHVRKIPAKLNGLKLWKRAFTWCEYAQRGHAEHPELLDKFEPYDEVSDLVHEAAIARKKLAASKHVTTDELASIANLSRIRIGNLVRNNQLTADRDARSSVRGSGYTFSAAVARAFLRERGVKGV